MAKKLENDLRRKEANRVEQKILLSIDIPPSVNHAYYTRNNGSRCLTTDSVKWINKTKAYIYAEMEKQGWKKEHSEVWFYADMIFHFPDRKIRDCHNTFKVMFDAIEETIFTNDYYVMPRVESVELDRENPRVDIIIYPQKVKVRNKILKLFKEVFK